ncbi:MAG TPA: PAS domain-containing sensor histidine kinase [Candidatus Paceibacterota bacterium]|nr:PAS domain-containing sensor histidine kinase [Candidatus Paceibacterota bacterium]
MTIRNKILAACGIIGIFQGLILFGSIVVYAAKITGESPLHVSKILAIFPGLSVASVLMPIVVASFVLSVLLLVGYLQYVLFDPLEKYKIDALKAQSGEQDVGIHEIPIDELGIVVSAYTTAIGRLRASYDTLLETLHSQYAVVGHDAEILKLLVDHLPLGVFLLREPSSEIMRMNELAAQFVGKNINRQNGETSFVHQNGSPYSEDELPYALVRKTKVPVTKSDIFFRYPDMRLAAFRMTSVPVLDTNGQLLYIISTLLDITDIKQVEREKSDFVSLASHQLRTPISIINWYVELLIAPLELEKLSVDQKEYIAQIKESSLRMSKLIDTLLNASRVELGTFHGDGTMFDLVQVTDIAIRDTMALAQSKHQHIEKTYDLSSPLISGEPKLGQVVVQNLISNAVKYTGDGGTIRISVESHPDEEAMYLTVIDNGIGIPDNEVGRIFSRFYRASNARDVDSSGSGLGLSIVRSLLERAGGKISFSKVDGGGTKFTVMLPYTCKNI